ncbi:MAG: dihydropteroate synthase, partial [Arenicellales bacterium]
RTLGVPVCLMHMKGTPETMQSSPRYQDVVREVFQFLGDRIEACLEKGLSRDQLIVDPGFGFGKTQGHNLQLMSALPAFLKLGVPLMIGVSRKAFIRRLSAADSGPELDQASAVMAVLAAERGARLLRVHDVKTTVRMLRLWSASTIDLGHTSSSEAIELR